MILKFYNGNYKTIDEIDRDFKTIEYPYKSYKWTRVIFMYIIHACINNARVLFMYEAHKNIRIKSFVKHLRDYCYAKAIELVKPNAYLDKFLCPKHHEDTRLSCTKHKYIHLPGKIKRVKCFTIYCMCYTVYFCSCKKVYCKHCQRDHVE